MNRVPILSRASNRESLVLWLPPGETTEERSVAVGLLCKEPRDGTGRDWGCLQEKWENLRIFSTGIVDYEFISDESSLEFDDYPFLTIPTHDLSKSQPWRPEIRGSSVGALRHCCVLFMANHCGCRPWLVLVGTGGRLEFFCNWAVAAIYLCWLMISSGNIPSGKLT